MTGSEYLFDGLVKRLAETQNHKDYYHLVMHEYLDGEFTQAFNKLLIKKHHQGVNIRIILCQAGSWQWSKYTPIHSSSESQLVQDLKEAGIDIRIQPLTWGLEHQKGIVYKIDGEWGMMMGGGTIIDQAAYPFGGSKFNGQRDALGFPLHDPIDIPEYYDMMISAKGDAAIAWQNIFLQRWLYLGGELNPTWSKGQIIKAYFTQPSSIQSNLNHIKAEEALQAKAHLSTLKRDEKIILMHNVPNTKGCAHPTIMSILENARSSIHIEVPYLLLEDVLHLCKEKAREGVLVNYLLPGASPRLSELLTNLTMTDWINEHIDLENVNIRLCRDRYNHGKLIAADIDDPENAVVTVMTSNLEPIISGGKNGGIAFDSICILENLHPSTLNQFSTLISRDFSPELSYPVTKESLKTQSTISKITAKIMFNTINYFFP